MTNNTKEEKFDSKDNKIKFPKPKILLLDLDKDSEKALKKAGFAIDIGSLGIPYKVEQSKNKIPVIRNHKLPDHFAESEIVVMDFAVEKFLDSPSGTRATPEGGIDYWANQNWGIVDPRIVTLKMFERDFIRILRHKGIFVIFADLLWQDIIFAEENYNGLNELDDAYDSLWSFHPLLNALKANIVTGSEISLAVNEDSIGAAMLASYVKESSYKCVFENVDSLKDVYISLTKNKFNQSVGGSLEIENGLILIFPQINNKGDFLVNLVKNILPELFPELFPFSEATTWINREEYEISAITQLRSEIKRIQTETETKIEELETQITKKREQFSLSK